MTPVSPGAYAMGALAEGFLPGFVHDGKDVVVGAGEAQERLDIVLLRGGVSLEGVVLDATGGPIRGAVVRTVTPVARSPSAVVESKLDGRFVLSVPPGLTDITVDAIGYASASVSHVAPSHDLTVTLLPGSSIQGFVVAELDGRSLPDIDVRAMPLPQSDGAPAGATLSGPDGAFAIHGLGPGTYTMIAEAKGLRGQAKAPVQLGLAQSIDRLIVTVSSSAQLSGAVLLRATNRPCSDGAVLLGPNGPPSPFDPPGEAGNDDRPGTEPSLRASIEADGAVHFRAVPPGVYHVIVQCSHNILREGRTSIEVDRSDVQGLVWKVGPGLGLLVRVVDTAAHPLPSTPFRLMWPRRLGTPFAPTAEPVSDSEGYYRLTGTLYPGLYTIAPAAGYGGMAVDIDLRDDVDQAEVTLRLAGQGAIVATVHTRNGDPIDSIALTAEGLRSHRATTKERRGDDAVGAEGAAAKPALISSLVPARTPAVPLGNGQYRIAPLAPGRYRIAIADALNSPGGDNDITAEVADGVTELNITLDRDATIRGRVVDDARQPLPDVWVSATCRVAKLGSSEGPTAIPSGKGVLSDAVGQFVLTGLDGASVCTVRAESSGIVGIRTNLRPGEEAIIVVPNQGALAGTAVAAGGGPVEQFTMAMNDAVTGSSRSEIVTTASGRWTVAGVGPGHWQLRAFASGGVAQQQVDVASGRTSEGVYLEFHKVPSGPPNPPLPE